jgi:hypothetical protein
MKKLMISCCLLFAGSLFSQDYLWQSTITTIDSPGFYKIDLEPIVLSKLNSNYSDIRIHDNKGNEVPYYFEKEDFSITKRVFKEYKLLEKVNWKNGATVLFIENTDKATINNLQLQIKNFDVRKRLELAGSDDYQQWYTIKENYLFYSADGNTTTSEVKALNFPFTDYKYYRIIIYDVFSLPINVLKIGYFDTYQEQGKFKQIEAPTINRFDSAETHQTYLKVSFKETPYFDKLTFKIEKPAYFHRNAKICLKHEDKKGRVYYEVLNYFVFNSNDELSFYNNDFSHKEFYIVIDNEDNPPIENIDIAAYQLNRYLVTHIEKDMVYQLVFGNKNKTVQPNYDISFFKNKVAEDIPILQTNEIVRIKNELKTKTKVSTVWIWISISVVAILLGYMSYKMIAEMEKK